MPGADPRGRSLFKAPEVCEIAKVQPYVLRSWEAEFPDLGVVRPGSSARVYRRQDVERVLRLKHLLFVEGLTLAGARRRLEESAPAPQRVTDSEVAEVLDALTSDARTRIAHVRDGLRSILKVLSNAPGTVVVVDDFQIDAPPVKRAAVKTRSAAARTKPRTIASARSTKTSKTKSKAKRGRASA